MVILTYFLLLFIPYAASITFNFTNIGPQHQSKDITLMGDGYISDDGIQVTTDGNETARSYREGRATYIQPLHLWDITSGELASFTTYFSFVIDSDSEKYYGDGLTFFLAENNSVIIGLFVLITFLAVVVLCVLISRLRHRNLVQPLLEKVPIPTNICRRYRYGYGDDMSSL